MKNDMLLSAVQEHVIAWREKDYPDILPETRTMLRHIQRVEYLHKPQLEALETYIYLKEIATVQTTAQLLHTLHKTAPDKLLLSLGLSNEQALAIAVDPERDKKTQALLAKTFGETDYANHVYALTMGAGKTVLMGTMIAYEFILSYHYPNDTRFGKNALVFAPDTTIVESLKEIKTFDYTRVVPDEYTHILLNIKYHYLESTDTPLNPNGNYNIVVSNSQKIILKTRHTNHAQDLLFRDTTFLKNRTIENNRLHAIRQLSNLVVFVDEAHHSYGKTLEGKLKKTRATIDYLHEKGQTPLTGVVNLTGTPYVNNTLIPDVVYHFGLHQGIEQGILKRVSFYRYDNVKSDEFIGYIVDSFLEKYSKRIDGRLPKMALYGATIEEVRHEILPALTRVLAQHDIAPDKILEYHTENESAKDEFNLLDTTESNKQFVVLVGKGKEGWNCKSLVACALYRKPRSTIFVLQSSTRCLRAIGDNSTVASVFVSSENAAVLEQELAKNFATSMGELEDQEQKTIEHTLQVIKKKTITVKKKLTDIQAVQQQNTTDITLSLDAFDPDLHRSYVTEHIIRSNGVAKYEQKGVRKKLTNNTPCLSYYDIVAQIAIQTHLPCVFIEQALHKNNITRTQLLSATQDTPAVMSFLSNELLKQALSYKQTTRVITEQLDITKRFPFTINRATHHDTLVVYRQDTDNSRLGFHINPYNFDSRDEKALFTYLRSVLNTNEIITDLYFTGGITSPAHNEFFVEYYSPELQRMARYFPDFLIETNNKKRYVVEVKTEQERMSYEQNKKQHKEGDSTVFNEVYAKELGFRQFQTLNKEFEYHIVFNAGLQAQQEKLYNAIQNE